MRERFFFLYLVLSLGIAFIRCQTTQYLLNPTMTDDNTPYQSKTQYTITSFSPISWGAYPLGSPTKPTTLRIVPCNRYIKSNPAQNCVRLGNDGSTPGSGNKRLCISQTIGSIPAGYYQLTYIVAPYLSDSNGDLHLQVVRSNIFSSSGKSFLPAPVTSSFTAFASYKKNVPLTLTSPQTNIKVEICLSVSSTRLASLVTQAKLTYVPCTNKLMQDSSTKCVPNSVIDANPNCYQFSVDTNNAYSCYGCNTSSSAPHKAPLDATNWACAQVKVPDVKYYKATSVVGSQNFLLIVPSTCQTGKTQSKSSYVAIPKFSDTKKDLTGRACRDDFSLIDVWDVRNVSNQLVYVGVNCSSGDLIDLVDSSQTKGCILTSEPEYTGQCKTYSYDSSKSKYTCTACNDLYSRYKVKKNSGTVWQCILTTTYNNLTPNCDVFDTSNVCSTCVSGFTAANVTIGGTSTVVKCLNDSSQTLPLCNSYTQNTSRSTFYCASNGCSSGTIITIGSSSNNGSACTSYPTFPQGNFQGACTLYARPKLATAGGLTYLKCSQCTTSGTNPDYCKFSTTDTRCTGDPTTILYGSDATANNGQVCAIDGFVKNCTAYASIDASKKLGLCTACEASVPNPALKDASTSICLAKLIPNCLYHATDGTCSQCKTDATYKKVNLVSSDTTSACISTSSEAFDDECKNYKYSSGVFTCQECNNGFDRYQVKKTGTVWMCFSASASSELDPNCDVYQSTSPYICSTCKDDYQTASVEVAGASAILKCLNENTELIPSCTKYTQATSTSTYYCKTGSCDSATQIQIDTLTSTNPNALACTTSTVFPAGNFQGGCNYYQRPTATSTVLKCSSCVSGSGDYCKIATGDTTCTGAPDTLTYGSPANVSGTETCAIDGFIASCNNYESINARVLGKCIGCDSTSSNPVVANLSATESKCIATSIVNCKYYNADGTCQKCNPGTVGTTVNLVESSQSKGCILTTNLNYDANCATYKYTTEFQCKTCGNGYTRAPVEINNAQAVYKCLNDSTQTLPNCTAYTQATSTSPYYCKTGSCSSGTEIVIGTDSSKMKACTKYSVFPVGTVQGACNYYDRPTLTSTSLGCSNCASGTGTFCLLFSADPLCTGAPGTSTYGVSVSVKGVIQCANNGLVTNCDDYNKITNGVVKECNRCNQNAPYLVNKTQIVQLCLVKLISNCKYYQQEGKCIECESGVPPQNNQATCPPNATKIIPFCQKVVKINGTSQCVTCTTGYMLDQAMKKCIVHVQYCSNYQNEVCINCVSNYTLVQNSCVKQVTNCQEYSNIGCKSCSGGMVVMNGACVKEIVANTCLPNQYKNSQGICVTGTDPNCAKFISPSGLCQNCKQGFQFNDKLQCKLKKINCPINPPGQKYVLQNGVCLLTDQNCLLYNNDGSCPVCIDGFYSWNGKCIAYQQQSSSSSGLSSAMQDQPQVDENGMYFIRENGGKYYLTGLWQGLQVLKDDKGNFYTMSKNNSRKYLTGPLKNMIAFKDSNGNWYAINAQGKKVYESGIFGNLQGSNFRGS